MNLIKKLIHRALGIEVVSALRQPQADREHAVRTVKPKDGNTCLAQHPSLWDDVMAMADSCIKAVRKLWVIPPAKRVSQEEMAAVYRRHTQTAAQAGYDLMKQGIRERLRMDQDARLRQLAAEAAAAARAKKPFLRWIAEEQRWGLDFVRSESTTHCSPKLFYCIAKFNLLNQKGKR